MSYPDSTPPPQSFLSPPFAGGDGGGYWPPFLMGNDHQQQQQPDLISQFDRPPPFKRPRTNEKPQNFSPFPQMNPRINPPNIPGNKGTSHIFYKTRICAKFTEGTCRNGEHCTFAHGAEDLREPPPNWQELIREKERGAGSGSWGDDQRMIHRMKICKKYYNGEDCPYGDKCNFLHERGPPPLKKFKVDMPGQRESSAISIGVTGDARGSSTDFDQTAYWKTKLCSKWEMGQCPFGERCHFAHGQSELKYSGTLDEAELVMNAVPVPRKAASVSAFSTPPANPMVAPPLNVDGEQKKTSKWKLTKKINRIYADWLDDLTPPNCSPGVEEI
ncbi:zinc finger CCCH domain-containing protein 39 isoform X1 [Sesamum indicum]|uniref:Zinc finger CCCH domain-containing protein 39 isoform X1 n=1 Tax=Sesamum indicum TaxID=4182 RepID=A0A6I9TE24_SESIN|nr:zinc finger CCCH domain-containing protein 39 isoform X1 [Sesamum indicum]